MAWNTRVARFYMVLATTALCDIALAATNDAWPQVLVPPQAETAGLGQEVVVNGTRARIRCFISRASPSELAAYFRKQLGQPVMEDRRDNKLILGRAEGQYYVTVQLDP